MGSLKYHDQESITAVIQQMKKDLNSLKKSRKGRSDAGVKRKKYDSNLPKQYRQYVTSANKRSIKFELTVEEFEEVTSGVCVYCGSTSKIGVDRIDSCDGYNIINVQPCCSTCNLMKFKHDEEFFLRHIVKVVKHRKLALSS